MTINFDIRNSYKNNLNAPEKFMVCRGASIYLRILGEEFNYEIMTATADEDNSIFTRVRNQSYLMEVALRVAANHKVKTYVIEDNFRREYVKICTVEYISDAFRISEEFFSIYDKHQEPEKRTQKEMQEVYKSISLDGSNQNIYLGENVWLKYDGFTQKQSK